MTAPEFRKPHPPTTDAGGNPTRKWSLIRARYCRFRARYMSGEQRRIQLEWARLFDNEARRAKA